MTEVTALTQYQDRLGQVADLLTAEEEQALAIEARAGCQKSRATLIERNLRLVVSVATKMKWQNRPLEERISDGNMGLIRAVDKFDPDHGTRFSTYAVWWIREAIQRGHYNTLGHSRLPIGNHHLITEMQRAAASINDHSDQAIAEATGWTLEKVRDVKSMWYQLQPVDRDDDEEEDPLHLGPNETLDPARQAEDDDMKETLARVIDSLPVADRDIVRLYYGFNGEPETFRQIGRRKNYTGSWAQQRMQSALEKMARRMKDAV